MHRTRIFHSLQSGGSFSKSEQDSVLGKTQHTATKTTIADDTEAECDELDFFGCNSKPTKAPSPPVYSSNKTTEPKAPLVVVEQQVTDDSLSSSNDEEESSDDEEQNSSLFKNNSSTKPSCAAKPKITKIQPHNDAITTFRKRMEIKVSGTNIPAPIATFDEMKISDTKLKSILLANIEASEYSEPTAVQMQAIPSMLLPNRDVLAIAPTGSGKTAAFVIPTLAQKTNLTGVQSIIVSPTRELATQIHAEVVRLCHGKKFKLCLLSKATAASLAIECKKPTFHLDVLVTTPLRLVSLLKSSQMCLDTVTSIVLDEADLFFELKFLSQVDEILAACTNPNVRRSMFSATLLEGVEELAKSVLRDPICIRVGVKNSGASSVTQQLMFVGREQGKILAIQELIANGFDAPALIFVQNKERAQALWHELSYASSASASTIDVIHADRSKEGRDEAIRRFRVGEVWILICTDLMARGIDLKAVNLVINYDFPTSGVSYVHRIGRTGRAGRLGKAITYYTESDMANLRSIANIMKQSGCEDVPEWMLSLKKRTANHKKLLASRPPKRNKIKSSIK